MFSAGQNRSTQICYEPSIQKCEFSNLNLPKIISAFSTHLRPLLSYNFLL